MICQLAVVLLGGFFVVPVLAADPLTISGITVTKSDKSATITWQTNRDALGKVEYGLYTNNYHWTVNTNQKKEDQAITISGLYPDTVYFFRITADDDTSQISSFEQSFKTEKESDNKSPILSEVNVPYTTGGTATVQWVTDEPATSEIEYGMTTNYGSSRNDGRLVKIHDLTISGLTDGTYYHFRAKSKDKNNNISKYYDMTFQTKLTYRTDNDSLIIYNIAPVSANDINIGETTAIISWRTNKLSEGWVRYGTTQSYGQTVATNPPRDHFHNITLTGLNPNQI